MLKHLLDYAIEDIEETMQYDEDFIKDEKEWFGKLNEDIEKLDPAGLKFHLIKTAFELNRLKIVLENLRPVIDDLIEEARADMEYDEDEYHHLIVENDALRERYKKSQNDKRESDKIINELTSENQEIKETLRRLHYKTSPEKGGKRKVFVVNELIHYEEGAQ